MPNRRLRPDELGAVDQILNQLRASLSALAGDDRELLFAARRRVMVQLTHDERGTPAHRNKIKAAKRAEQNGLCALCAEELPQKYAELDRFNASEGYTIENTRLVHHACHVADQARKRYL